MKNIIKTTLVVFCVATTQIGHSQIVSLNKNAQKELFREIPSLRTSKKIEKDNFKEKEEDEKKFKPSIQIGSIIHMFAAYQQNGFGPGGNRETIDNDPDAWSKDFNVYRARILVGGKLSKNGSFFLETDLPSIIGRGSEDSKNTQVSPIILDAQYEHTFGNHMVVAGLQLVSHNRNGLQGAASLLANDFSFFQYPYNLFPDSPLQGNFGRDLGVNARGFFLDDKLEYRFGIFTGRNTGEFVNDDPALRYVGRVVYNFLDAEKDYYYAGTKLGEGKTFALAAGFDAQGTYSNFGIDTFIDVPLGSAGSITANAAFSAITGGTDTDGTSFATLIPKSTTQFLELGYYFKKAKLQPWIRYEKNNVDADGLVQTGGIPEGVFNDLNTATVFGGGLNYWFAGYNTNIRLSYTTWTQENSAGSSQTQGQIWLQTQFFIF